ncbi:MAG: hypothetical protein WCC06_06910 [Candidatus Aminicenantales bacterium]
MKEKEIKIEKAEVKMTPDIAGEKKKEKSGILRVFSSPVANMLAFLVGILGIGLAIYFWQESKLERELVFLSHPVKATVVKAGQTSSIEIFYKNEKINTDVTAVQVAIWNRGKRPIEKNDILEEVVLLTRPKTPILDAEIRKISRGIIDLNINKEGFQEGRIPVSWRVLEKNDGGSIQIIIAGSSKVEIAVDGTIIEQGPVKDISYKGNFPGAQEQYKERKKERNEILFLFLGIITFNIIISLIVYLQSKKRKRHIGLKSYFPIFFITIAYITVLIIIMIITRRIIEPPWGF